MNQPSEQNAFLSTSYYKIQPRLIGDKANVYL